MELMKVNTLNDSATQIFRQNLKNEGAKYKQLGSAFVLPSHTANFHPTAFDGLWQGYDANIEIQKINRFDEAEYHSI